MGAHRVNILGLGAEGHPDWNQRWRCEWGEVVGTRVRRLRADRGLRILDLAEKLRRSDGRHYSGSFVSRLERGWTSPPLFVYIMIAELFAVAPGDLLGRDGVERIVSDAEITLVKVVRELGLSPEEAIAKLVRPG